MSNHRTPQETFDRYYDRIFKLSKKNPTNNYLDQYEYYLEGTYEITTLDLYAKYAQFALNENIDTIYDIGCAYGIERIPIDYYGLNYIGIDYDKYARHYGKLKGHYIAGKYPFPIKTKKPSFAVSSLCIGFFDLTNDRTFNQLSEDFTFLGLSIDEIPIIFKYFKPYEHSFYINNVDKIRIDYDIYKSLKA